MQIILDSFNLNSAERQLCEQALKGAGSIVGAAGLLGITRHALKRRMIKHNIRWRGWSGATVPESAPS